MRGHYKKIVYFFIFITKSLFSIETIKIAEEYPYKDSPLMATVFGTPKESFMKIEKFKLPKTKKLKAIKDVPNIFKPWSDYPYGMWLQNEEAPVVILVAGTGALYNSSMNLYFANIFYQEGYSVFAFGSTTTTPFMTSQSKYSYGGYLLEEAEVMYDIIAKAVSDEKEKGLKISDVYITGYSLGGFQSLQIQEIDSRKKEIGIKKSMLLNSPISIYDASAILDNYLIEAEIYDAKDLEKYIDRVYGRVMLNETMSFDSFDFSNLEGFLEKLDIKHNDLGILTGLLFRFRAMNFVFSGEVYEGKGDRLLKGDPLPKQFDTITKYFLDGLSISYDEYVTDILHPYIHEKTGKYPTIEEFLETFSLDYYNDFIKKNNEDIIFITSIDDILIKEKDLQYIEENFQNRVIIPYGGHTGILWHKEVVQLILDKLEEK